VNPHANNVASLIEFRTRSEIRVIWQQIDASLQARATETVTINSKTVDGRTTSAIVLSTPEEKHAYIAACRDAIAQIDGQPPVSNPRIQNDFSEGQVLV
jgi:hypothetical protein